MVSLTALLTGRRTVSADVRAGRAAGLHFADAGRPVVAWNVTRACNLACRHCYLSAGTEPGGDELSTGEARALVEDLAAMGVPVLLLSGGEPLLRPDVLELARLGRDRGLRVALSTNGTLLTRTRAREAADAGVAYVGVSLDGLEAAHDAFRRRKGAFGEALAGLAACRAAGVRSGVRLTVTRHNAAEVGGVLDLAEREGIDRVCVYHLVYAGRGEALASEDIDAAARRALVTTLLERALDWARRGVPIELLTTDQHADGPFALGALARLAPERVEAARGLLASHSGCSAGRKMANVSPEGEVHPCQFWTHESAGSVRERPFSAIWTDPGSPVLALLRRMPDAVTGARCSACVHRSVCGGCRIRARAAHGDLWGDDPACYLTDAEISAG